MFIINIKCENTAKVATVQFNSYADANHGRAFKVTTLFVYNQDLLNMLKNMTVDSYITNAKSILMENASHLQVITSQLITAKNYPAIKQTLDDKKLLLATVIIADLRVDKSHVNRRLVISGDNENICVRIDYEGLSLEK